MNNTLSQTLDQINKMPTEACNQSAYKNYYFCSDPGFSANGKFAAMLISIIN
jgi:hypothetical protein